jgi:IclR family transcriptional regulator, KDG regulon repressor
MPSSGSQTLVRGISILDCFSPDTTELGVREAARRLGLSRSTVGRLLTTMHTAGILSQIPTTGAYALGPKVLAWASAYTYTLDVRAKALPALKELHRLTRESVTLYILDGDERVCVERIESPEHIRVFVRLGERMPLHAGASGKVFLAFLPAERREELLKSIRLSRLTPNTIVKRTQLARELATIRKQGYAVSVGERVLGAASVAAPIYGAGGNLVAALNITGPMPRVTDAKLSEYVPLVVKASAQISREMGYGISRCNGTAGDSRIAAPEGQSGRPGGLRRNVPRARGPKDSDPCKTAG